MTNYQTEQEQHHLEGIASHSLYAAGVNPETIKYSFKIAQRHWQGKTVLELGPAEGVMTELLVTTGMEITAVDGSALFCKQLKARFPQITVINSLFEDLRLEQQFDNIVLGHVLEHVQDPVQILKTIKPFLAPHGHIFAAVPNARSLHRQAAVIMRLLETEDTLNDMDKHHGHRRVFTPESFRHAFSQADLQIDLFGGYWLKPLSNKQIESHWNSEMLDAFMQLGERYPDIAGEIYILASSQPEVKKLLCR